MAKKEKIMDDKTREFYEKFHGKKITHKDWLKDEWIIINKIQPVELIRQGMFQAKDNIGNKNCYIGNHWIIHPDSVPCPCCGRILSNPFLGTPQELAAKRYRDNSTA